MPQILKSIGPNLWISLAHKTPTYDTRLLLKTIFDKPAFVKFKINNNLNKIILKHIQNNQTSIGKSIPALAYKFENTQEKNPQTKVSRFLLNFCDFQNENNTLGYGYKNLQKSYSLGYGFLFFVIFISDMINYIFREIFVGFYSMQYICRRVKNISFSKKHGTT
jgi:hypothetical protein